MKNNKFPNWVGANFLLGDVVTLALDFQVVHKGNGVLDLDFFKVPDTVYDLVPEKYRDTVYDLVSDSFEKVLNSKRDSDDFFVVFEEKLKIMSDKFKFTMITDSVLTEIKWLGIAIVIEESKQSFDELEENLKLELGIKNKVVSKEEVVVPVIPNVIDSYQGKSLLSLLDSKDLENTVFETKIVGTTFRPDGQNILKYLSDIDRFKLKLSFEREPNNDYDKNAVKVLVGVDWSKKHHHLGYIPRQIADFWSYLLDGDEYLINITGIDIVGGGSIASNYGLKFCYMVKKK